MIIERDIVAIGNGMCTTEFLTLIDSEKLTRNSANLDGGEKCTRPASTENVRRRRLSREEDDHPHTTNKDYTREQEEAVKRYFTVTHCVHALK